MKIISSIIFCGILLALGCERVSSPPSGNLQQPPQVLNAEGGAQTPGKEGGSNTPSVNVANVVLYPKEGSPVVFSAEVAKTIEEKRTGLQGREDLPEKHGMWFVFDGDVQDPFWMKDTPVALDILFVDKDFKIVDLFANTTPNSEALISPHQKYRYAFEVKAGTAAAYRITVGDRAEFRLGPP